MKIILSLILAALATGCAFTPYTHEELAQLDAARQRQEPREHQGIFQAVGEEARYQSLKGR